MPADSPILSSTGRFTTELRRLGHYCHDHCSRCGQKFPTGIPAYAGYDKRGQPVYVGRCCLAEIAELASHMYWWWESYKRPAANAPLWRYMDFAKFIALLTDNGVYFSRVDLLGDRFEGARGVASREPEWRQNSLTYLTEAILNAPDVHPPVDREDALKQAEVLYDLIASHSASEIRRTYVSCWHENEGESEALWRLYCPPLSTGVAVHTDFASLDAALDPGSGAVFGHVQYVDFNKSFAGSYDRVFWKRKPLSHEAEVRGVIHRMEIDPLPSGVIVPADLERLTKKLVISPFAPPWFEAVLQNTIKTFGLTLPVYRSELEAEPFF